MSRALSVRRDVMYQETLFNDPAKNYLLTENTDLEDLAEGVRVPEGEGRERTEAEGTNGPQEGGDK
jgi:hypothetical protein